jgi:hypothetical protein
MELLNALFKYLLECCIGVCKTYYYRVLVLQLLTYLQRGY